ncbi:helix-turn-helix domain-containing protein [Streptomyces thinghirensis]|uniref:HTH cro/C1-type domain-containing protein n=1 Tax=Streptomyces thinghirensis TaxID=551547 RepID=A0ABP9TIJ8_9ACTN
MARPEAPVDHTVPELGKFAELLRSLRRQAGWTYAEMAAETAVSAATLKRAASGKHLPNLTVTIQYAASCITRLPDPDALVGASVMALWQKAATAVDEAKRTGHRSTVLPKPQYVRDEGDLSGALRDAWAWSGRPSTRCVEKASNGQVPRSTANVIVSARGVPRDFRQYAAYLRACRVTGKTLEPWIQAWFKVRGIPSDPIPGFMALHEDGDAQAAYASVYARATGSAASVAEVLERLLVGPDHNKAAAAPQIQRTMPKRNWRARRGVLPYLLVTHPDRSGGTLHTAAELDQLARIFLKPTAQKTKADKHRMDLNGYQLGQLLQWSDCGVLPKRRLLPEHPLYRTGRIRRTADLVESDTSRP